MSSSVRIIRFLFVLTSVAVLAGCAGFKHEEIPPPMTRAEMESFFLPGEAASKMVTISTSTNLPVNANILVQTHAVAIKETGPKETIARFGEVYAFSPAFIAVYRDQPTMIRFWNLQPDDNHDFMLIAPNGTVLMKALLPPLKETPFVFTFHQEGLFNFICAMHQPAMAGQILVLPPQ
jgi:plastocyanin